MQPCMDVRLGKHLGHKSGFIHFTALGSLLPGSPSRRSDRSHYGTSTEVVSVSSAEFLTFPKDPKY